MYNELKRINSRPRPWECYTTDMLWTDPHIAQQMLSYHLDETVDAASRNPAFIRRSVDWMIDRFGIGENTSIADFGCGPGFYTLPLAQTGAKVTGIDFSENSLRYARERADEQGLDIDYIEHDYLTFETDQRFDLIIMIMCDFSAISPTQRAALLQKFRKLLKSGGAVVLDVDTENWYQQQHESASYECNHMNGFWSAGDYYAFINTFKYDDERVILDKYTIFEADRTRTIYNWMQTYTRESLTQECNENGLDIKEWYTDVAGTPYDPDTPVMAVVAQSR